jgi:hypothetical protein
VLAAAFGEGVRAVRGALGGLRVGLVVVDRRATTNVNHPDDLHR